MNIKTLAIIVTLIIIYFLYNNRSNNFENSDNQRATAAVSLAGGTMGDENLPNPTPSPDKYPRKDCPYCKGTGYIVHGDGHKTECTHCVPDNNGPFTNRQCCPDCTCGYNCRCEYPGECLIAANGGRPVKICDENGCRVYYPPYYQPPVENLSKIKEYMQEANAAYNAKNYVLAFNKVLAMEEFLNNGNFVSAEANSLRKKVEAGKKKILTQISVLPKQQYHKFVQDYNKWIKKYKASQKTETAYSYNFGGTCGSWESSGFSMGCSGGSCGGGSCCGR